jgi:dTDP-4-amino-4,6-dideoxygalactose transaminase
MQVDLIGLGAQYSYLRGQINDAVINTLEQISLGSNQHVRAFETEFAAYCRARFAVGVGSGTDAIYLALRACGIRAGDEVITVANGHVSKVEAIVLLGATPVFIDVDPQTYTMNPDRIEAAITPLTRAILPVHLYGQMADMESIVAIARRHGLAVIEDACHAAGAMDQGKRAGSFGDAAAFSFGIAHNLGAYGEAGAVVSSSYAITECVRALREHGPASEYDHKALKRYEDQGIGLNARLDELQAAILRIKLRYLDQWNEQRAQHARSYGLLLDGQPCVRPAVRLGATHVYQFYVVQVLDRDHLRQCLTNRGIRTGVHYPAPLHRQLACHTVGRVAGSLPVTEALAHDILSLPMYPELQPGDIEYVAACLKEQLGMLAAGRSRRLGDYPGGAYPRREYGAQANGEQQSYQPAM